LVGDDLEKRSAPAAGLAKHQNHFPGFCDTSEVLEDIKFSSFPTIPEDVHQCLRNIEEGDKGIRKGLDDILDSTNTTDSQVLPMSALGKLTSLSYPPAFRADSTNTLIENSSGRSRTECKITLEYE